MIYVYFTSQCPSPILPPKLIVGVLRRSIQNVTLLIQSAQRVADNGTRAHAFNEATKEAFVLISLKSANRGSHILIYKNHCC